MKQFFIGALAGCVMVATGCRDSSQQKSDDHGHSHGPPHGGTPVLVAEHKYHLELVRDPATGLMQAYVLDDDMHDFVRVPETNFTLVGRANRAGGVSAHDKRNESVAFRSIVSF
jgi:hypothetical protein